MELVRIKIKLQFQEKDHLSTPAYKVYKALGGEKTGGEVREPGAKLHIKEQKARVLWDYDEASVSIESI